MSFRELCGEGRKRYGIRVGQKEARDSDRPPPDPLDAASIFDGNFVFAGILRMR